MIDRPIPYPGTADPEITEFEYIDPLITGRMPVMIDPGVEWIVWKDYRVAYKIDDDWTTLTIPEGFRTDFSSVPAALRSIISKIGPHSEASVVHDYLYVRWKDFYRRARSQDRLFADRVFRAGLEAANVSDAGLMYRAVRLGGWNAFAT